MSDYEINSQRFEHNELFYQAKKLYSLCFPSDSHSFKEHLFANKLINCTIYTLKIEGELASMLFVVPKKLRILSQVHTVPFLVACATHPNERKKGLLTALFEQFYIDSYKSGVPFVLLEPFEHGFYRRLGFETICHAHAYSLKHDLGEKISLDRAFSIFNQSTNRYKICQYRGIEELGQKLNELEIDGGCFMAVRHGTKGGFAAVDEGELGEVHLVNEHEPLGAQILRSKKRIERTQARIIHAQNAIRMLSQSLKGDCTFNLTDGFIEQNCASFSVTYQKESKQYSILSQTNALSSAPTITINQLSSALFGCGQARLMPYFKRFNTAFFDKF